MKEEEEEKEAEEEEKQEEEEGEEEGEGKGKEKLEEEKEEEKERGRRRRRTRERRGRIRKRGRRAPGWFSQLNGCLWIRVMIPGSCDPAPCLAPCSTGTCFSPSSSLVLSIYVAGCLTLK